MMSSIRTSRRAMVGAGAMGLAALSRIRTRPLSVMAQATPAATPEDAVNALSPQEAQTIAEETFIYGFPMVETYKTLYQYAIEVGGSQYRAPFNEIASTARAYTPADTAFISPNSDTPYSFVSLDLRAEPLVLTVAPIEKDRYFSFQTNDLYTYLAPYIGSRTTGNGGGTFLFAGPNWTGTTPDGITMVIEIPTELGLITGRTQLFGPDEVENVAKVQAGYTTEPVSQFLGESAPPPAPAVEWLPYDEAAAEGLGFFEYLSFLLQFAPVLPEDQAIRERMARIGVVPGQPFDVETLSAEMQAALQAGIDAANTQINTQMAATTSGDELFGTREFLKGRNLDRAVGVRYGIFANAKEEAKYIAYSVDAAGQPATGSGAGYTLHFAAGELPPVNAFWSVTIYDGKTQLLVANPINRYLINSPMLPELIKDTDGGVTLYLQHDAPASEREANWLPLPDGPFYGVLRMYWPKEAVISGEWQAPALQPAG